MTDIVLFDFLLLLLVYFILHYHLIFREGIFFFFSNVYILVNTIFKCCYKLTNLIVAVVIQRNSTKFCVKEIKEKSVTFNQGKRKFLQNHCGLRWGAGEGWLFCREFRPLLSKLMFSDSDVAMEYWKRKTRNYHQKLNAQVALRIAKQFRIHNLRKWGTFKDVYLSFHWFNDSRGFELVTRGFELITRGYELKTRRFELVTHGFELVTRRFELATRGFELVTGGFELLTGGFELLTRGFELVTCEFEFLIRGFEFVTRGFELVTSRFELALLNFNSCF